MKTCPHCAEEIQDAAVKCKHCGERLDTARHGAELADRPTERGLAVGAELGGRYRILAVAGRGGMGVVYRAEDQTLGIEVAVKVLPPEVSCDARAVAALKAEAKLCLGLTHPNIVRLFDFREMEGLSCLIMEHVGGGSLLQRLSQHPGGLPEAEAVRCALQATAGLGHAHARGVLHRDVKPANLLVGDDGAVKVADFGIARIAQDSLTRATGHVTSGTFVYMGPEQLDGEACDARSDIYSLGITLYELLSGQVPFHTGDIYRQQKEKAPARLAGVSDWLWTVLERMLAKVPSERYQAMAEVVAALEQGPAQEIRAAQAAAQKAEDERRARAGAEKRKAEEDRQVRERQEDLARKKEEEDRRKPDEQKGSESREAASKSAEELQHQQEAEKARAAEEKKTMPGEVIRRRRDQPRKRGVIAAAVGMVALLLIGVIYWQRHQGSPEPGQSWQEPKTGMEFVWIPAGNFEIGSNGKQIGRVRVDGFWMGRSEVTQGQWRAVMGNNPSRFSSCGKDCPVEQVSWDDAQEYISRLAKQSGKAFRLPTNAEWEYAAGDGTAQQIHAGTDGMADLGEYAWSNHNSGGQTHRVCTRQSNRFGLCDMRGNVSEWCQDWFGGGYPSGESSNPTGKTSSSVDERTTRGGNWSEYGSGMTVQNIDRGNGRIWGTNPSTRNDYLGFRLVLPAGQK